MINENGFIDYKKLDRLIDTKTRNINDELFRKYFLVQDLGRMLKKLVRLRNNPERNKIQVDWINSGLKNLKKEIGDMSKEEIKIGNPNETVNLVEKILAINRQQQGQILKILTNNQMLGGLPLSLA